MSTDSFRYLINQLAESNSNVAELQPCLQLLIASFSDELPPLVRYALEDLLQMGASTKVQFSAIHFMVLLLLDSPRNDKKVDSHSQAA